MNARLGLFLAAIALGVASTILMAVAVLWEMRILAPRVRDQVTHAPDWVREHTPEPLTPRRLGAELGEIREDLRHIRSALDDERAERGA